jgi:hypothetical protein
MTGVESFLTKELNSLLFFEEFTFSRNKFSVPSEGELELADGVVKLGDVLIVYQIKERAPASVGQIEAERRWFKTQVLGKATRQVRDTLRYLQTHSEIQIPNERGRRFNLAATTFADIVKIVIYLPAQNLPADCRRVRHHLSKTTGAFIHIVDAHDYLEILRTLRVPEEVVRYFNYRQAVFARLGDVHPDLPEAAIAGHFIGDNPSTPPTIQSAMHLRRLDQDTENWDLAPLLRGLYKHTAEPGWNDDYYDILIEFAKLPRSAWRAVKERIVLCIEKVRSDQFTRPYRMVYPDTNCGFVFISVHSDIARRDDWPTTRVRGLTQLTRAHKYDQRLRKCIGFQVARDGPCFDILWSCVDHEWIEDAELQRALAKNFPFRVVKPAEIYGYRSLDN